MAVTTATETAPVLLGVEGLDKSFGATAALSDFDFTVHAGEIHGLVGENGAGKSTFIKLLAGLHDPDAGTIAFAPGAGDRRPIAFIHQDLGLVGAMSVTDNLLLGAPYPRCGGVIDWRAARRDAAASLARVGATFEPSTDVDALSTADRALVAIARALRLSAQVLVLDEPTANLPGSDVDRLFAVLRALRDDGIGIIYVSHRLREVLALADTVTVLRDGRRRHVGPAHELTEGRVVELMTGLSRDAHATTHAANEPGDVVLELTGLSTSALAPTDLEVREGQIAGCVGLRGAGQEQIGRALFGLVPFRGSATLRGRPLRPADPHEALREGVSFVSGDRTATVARTMSVQENLLMAPATTPVPGWLRGPRREQGAARRAIEAFNVRPADPAKPIAELSGGNAQKVVFARGMGNDPNLVILEEPTAGVDLPTRRALYGVMRREAAAGKVFLLASSDHDEIAEICDVVHVFRAGRLVGRLEPPFDSEYIAELIAGGPHARD